MYEQFENDFLNIFADRGITDFEAYNEAIKNGTLKACEKYMSDFPNGMFLEEIKNKITEIKRIQRQKELEEKKRRDEEQRQKEIEKSQKIIDFTGNPIEKIKFNAKIPKELGRVIAYARNDSNLIMVFIFIFTGLLTWLVCIFGNELKNPIGFFFIGCLFFLVGIIFLRNHYICPNETYICVNGIFNSNNIILYKDIKKFYVSERARLEIKVVPETRSIIIIDSESVLDIFHSNNILKEFNWKNITRV